MGVTLQTGRFTATFPDVTYFPAGRRKPWLSPVIYLHSLAGGATEANGEGIGNGPARILKALCDAGFAVFSPTQPFASFGNGTASPAGGDATGQGRLHDAITYAASLGYSGKPVLIGTSQGSTCVLRYAGLNPTLSACVVGILPVSALQAAYAGNVSGNQTNIGTAYGVTYPTPLPSTADPSGATLSTALATVPLQLWYSDVDPWWTTASGGSAFVTATGAESHDMGATDHTNATILLVPPPSVVEFVKAHAT